jgi:hypothetical protein
MVKCWRSSPCTAPFGNHPKDKLELNAVRRTPLLCSAQPHKYSSSKHSSRRNTPPYTMAFLATPHLGSTVSECSSVFYPFPRLPQELRHKIWTLYLSDATPQMYSFELRYPCRLTHDPWCNNLRPSDQVFLQPLPCVIPDNKYFLQPLRASSTTRHIASATCVESRQVVLETCPDTLRFRHFPGGWMHSKYKSPADRPDGTGYPEYTLRFNATKDIIVFHAGWEDQAAAVKVSELRGLPPDDFLKIRHVGIAVGSFRVQYRHMDTQWGTPFERNSCKCKTEVCQDYCKEEPLPKFLSLFPSLETFYVSGVPSGGVHKPGDQGHAGEGPSGDANCSCLNVRQRHSWPMIRSPGVCGWFAIYDERSACPFPKFDPVEEIRQRWRPHFPYYRALDNLDIKFIQLWDPVCCTNSRLCNLCVYSRVYPR